MEVGVKVELAEPILKGHLEYAYPHGDGFLIMGWCSELTDTDNKISLILGVSEREEKVSLSSCVRYWRPDVAASLRVSTDESEALYGFVATFVLPEATANIELLGASLVHEDKPEDIVSLLVPECVAVEEAMKENWAIWYRVIKYASYTLTMHKAFETLVERFGKVESSEGIISSHYLRRDYSNPLRLGLEFCARLSDTSIIILGWALSLDNQMPLTDLKLLRVEDEQADTANDQSISISNRLMWLPRADVLDLFELKQNRDPVGFICLLEGFQAHTDKLTLSAVADSGAEMKAELALSDYSADPFGLSEKLFQFVSPESGYMRKVLTEHIGPALKMVWSNYRKLGFLTASSRQLISFGQEPVNPKVSVIIPLYKRFDFLEYQLSQFALDPFMSEVEIIYVNDDPKSQAGLINYCHGNSPIFDVPFKLLHGGKNLGYAGANNLGVSIAKADTLLLLNSDVMPKEPGWLAKMLEAYRRIPDVGALGVRLLYEDGSLQHDGMRYVKFPFFQDMWICEHPFKGLSPMLRQDYGLQEVEAVTGACLMVDKERFKQVGGLDKNYILGDFEDSDLCLKMRVKGFKSYLLSNVSLYHLERQSQNLFSNADWKTKLTLYNCWQHTERWDSVISQLKEVMA